jgi:hypothetical protein
LLGIDGFAAFLLTDAVRIIGANNSSAAHDENAVASIKSDVLRGAGARGPGLFADKATIIRCSGDSLSSEQMRHLESHRCEFFEGVLADSPTL